MMVATFRPQGDQRMERNHLSSSADGVFKFINESLSSLEIIPCHDIKIRGILVITSSKALYAIKMIGCNVPLAVVGRSTALAAKEAGFPNLVHVACDVESLIMWLLTRDDPITYARGNVVSADLAKLLPDRVTEHMVYRTHYATSFSSDFIEKIHMVRRLLFFSYNSAVVFSDIVNKTGVLFNNTIAISMSEKIDSGLQIANGCSLRSLVSGRKDYNSVIEKLYESASL